MIKKHTELFFTLLFVTFLICALAAFFFGVKIGYNQASLKYKQNDTDQIFISEMQQTQEQLSTFYHTIFLPFGEFKARWFETTGYIHHDEKIKKQYKQLSAEANRLYETLEKSSQQEFTPLLKQAHDHYLKSSHLFMRAAKQFANANTFEEPTGQITLHEALRFNSLGQIDYYQAMTEWLYISENGSLNLNDIQTNMSVDQWTKLNLNEKNLIAAYLINQSDVTVTVTNVFYPHDLAARIDEIIEIEPSNIENSIQEIGKTLIHTRSVRSGDFYQYYKDRLDMEYLPNIPLFNVPSRL